MTQTTDYLVGRRVPEWYVGKVLLVRGRMVPPGYPQGYYRVTSYNRATDAFDYQPIGPIAPQGEPIYIHEGRRDMQAVPSTVAPGVWEWILWPLLYLVLVIGAFGNASDPAAGIFVTVICLPVLVMPLWSWYYNVDPVRGRKIGYSILAVTTANNVRNSR